MGKTARWLKGFLSGKKEASSSPDSKPVKEKKKKKKGWSFVRSLKDKTTTTTPNVVDRKRGFHSEQLSYNAGGVEDQNHHAIAVAAATAAAAEAAVAAAQAAAAVVRLTSNSGRCNSTNRSLGKREQWEWAAVKIQAAFRGYLARRALRALKGLVRLQALVRGHIVRKGMVENLRCLQALVRAQARARAGRIHISESQYSYSKQLLSHNPGPATPEKLEQPICASSARYDRSPYLKRNNSRSNIRHGNNVDRKQSAKNRFDHWMDECIRDRFRETSVKATDDEKSDKILEIDTGKPHSNSKQKNDVHHSSKYCTPSDQNSNGFFTIASPSRDSTTAQLSARSSSSDEVQSLNPYKLNHEVDDSAFWTANNSPKCVSATSRPGSAKGRTFTPAKSECSQNYFSGYSGSRSFISGYSDYPNFMANTESFRAKVRSQSAPKQRPEFDNSSSAKRFSANGFGDTRSNAQRVSALHANFKSKAYPGSGRLDRLGMPIYSDSLSSSGLYVHNRY